MKMHQSIPEVGKLYNNEMIFYEASVFNDDKDELEAELILQNGGASIYVKICESLCATFTLEEAIKNPENFNFISEGHGDKSIVFFPKCPSSNVNCSILFGLLGKNPLADASSYTFLLKKKYTMAVLIENEKYETHIEYGEKDYFKLYLDNEKNDIEKIKFSINTDIEYIVSINRLCENMEECEEKKGNGRNFVELNSDIMFIFLND